MASIAQPEMKRDGRTVSRAALEEMRLMALARMKEGESPAEVAASFGLHRGWAYKVLAKATGRGRGKRALLSTKAPDRARTLSAAQERQVFGWVNDKNPRQHGFDFGLWTRQIVRELIA
jgi:transposase